MVLLGFSGKNFLKKIIKYLDKALTSQVRRAVLRVASTRWLGHSFIFGIQRGTRIPAFKILMVDRNAVMAIEPDSLISASGRNVDVIQVDLDGGESNAEASGMTQYVPEHEGCPALATPLWNQSVFLDPESVLLRKDPECHKTEDRACIFQHPHAVGMLMIALLDPVCLLDPPILIGIAPDASVNVLADDINVGGMDWRVAGDYDLIHAGEVSVSGLSQNHPVALCNDRGFTFSHILSSLSSWPNGRHQRLVLALPTGTPLTPPPHVIDGPHLDLATRAQVRCMQWLSTWTKLMRYFSSVRPELVEGLFMVRQAHHERSYRI
jgi:hypothetical protein